MKANLEKELLLAEMLGWYRSQAVSSTKAALRAKRCGNKAMEHFYTQERLNYSNRIKEVEDEIRVEN